MNLKELHEKLSSNGNGEFFLISDRIFIRHGAAIIPFIELYDDRMWVYLSYETIKETEQVKFILEEAGLIWFYKAVYASNIPNSKESISITLEKLLMMEFSIMEFTPFDERIFNGLHISENLILLVSTYDHFDLLIEEIDKLITKWSVNRRPYDFYFNRTKSVEDLIKFRRNIIITNIEQTFL